MQKNVWGGRIKLSVALNVPAGKATYEIPRACEQPIEQPHQAQHTCSVDATNQQLTHQQCGGAEDGTHRKECTKDIHASVHRFGVDRGRFTRVSSVEQKQD
jgi:hypothetical protein